jgi:ATP-dependent helicase/nuclease subunit B
VIEAMTVTEFGWYLRCPFRYYLKYIRRLREVEDSAVELDALQFGNLTHEVLQHFGEDHESAAAPTPSTSPATSRSCSSTRPRRLRRQPAAGDPHPARPPARAPAGVRPPPGPPPPEGWKIRRCEFELPEATYLEIPDQAPMRIKGKIDRIDQNERDGSWMIIDYKTSEAGKTPDKHPQGRRSSGRVWDDLQLPLYHHLAAQHGSQRLRPARLHEPAEEGRAGGPPRRPLVPADLDDAIGTARDIVRNIRAGRFDMADDYPARFEDAFANICQTRVFGGADDLENEA